MAKKVFKRHQFGQIMLLPPSLDEMIDKNHPVRVVSQVIDQIDISPLEKKYKGGGTSNYHPRVLLKVLVYAHLDNVISSRRIISDMKIRRNSLESAIIILRRILMPALCV